MIQVFTTLFTIWVILLFKTWDNTFLWAFTFVFGGGALSILASLFTMLRGD